MKREGGEKDEIMREIEYKYIYRITNLLNNKIYIGQTKNIKERFQRHCSPSNDSVIGRAIQKYGKENFDFTILEGPIQNYNEREDYWIKFYNCRTPNGYNVVGGGTQNRIGLQGEEVGTSVYSEEQIKKVINDLKNTNLSFREIAEKNNIAQITTINLINKGKAWKQKNEQYPIRKSLQEKIISQYDTIITMLKNGNTEKEIEQCTNIGHTTIDKINKGIIYRQDNQHYPIRTVDSVGKRKEQIEKAKRIVEDILNTSLSFKEIAIKNNINLSVVYRINNGQSHPELSSFHPIRKL